MTTCVEVDGVGLNSFYKPHHDRQQESRLNKKDFMLMEANRGKKHILVPFDRADSSGNFSLNGLTEGRYDVVARAITSSFFYSCGVRCDVSMSLSLGPSSVDGLRKTVRIDGSEVKHLRPDERTVCSLLQRLLGGNAPEKQSSKQKEAHRRVPNMIKNKDASDRCLAGWRVYPHSFEVEVAAVIEDLLTRNCSNNEGPFSVSGDVDTETLSNPPPPVPALSLSEGELPVCVLYLMEDGQPLFELLTGLQNRNRNRNRSPQHACASTSAEEHSTSGIHISHRTNFLIILGDDRGLSGNQEEELYRVLFGERGTTDTDGVTCFPGVSFHRCCIGKRPLLASQCILLTLHIIESVFP